MKDFQAFVPHTSPFEDSTTEPKLSFLLEELFHIIRDIGYPYHCNQPMDGIEDANERVLFTCIICGCQEHLYSDLD